MENEYLIIGGTTKAATTSLFFYLKDHPDVCASSIKESRYWLSQDYPLASVSRYDGINEYDEYFDKCDAKKIRMEATPDYLYSIPTPNWIHQEYGTHSKIIFILRNPIDRLISWYNFAKQDGFLSNDETLEGYVKKMLEIEGTTPDKQYLLALRQGKYMNYLQGWFEVFPKDQIKLVFFEDLSSDPKKSLTEICEFAKIDKEFYDQYVFQVANKTQSLKSGRIHGIYKKIRFKVRSRTHKYPMIHLFFKTMRRYIEPVYLKMNENKDSKVENLVSSKIRKQLYEYYEKDIKALEKKIGHSLSTIWI